MPEFHLGRQQTTISNNCMYQTHSMVLTTAYHIQNYPILTVICCGTSNLCNQSNHNSLKPLHSNNKFYAPCSTPWSADTQLLLLAHISHTHTHTHTKVVTMATKCNSHQQHSECFRTSHVKWRSPIWVCRCNFKLHDCLKDFLHT